jgi:hypothetical protein
MAKRTCHLLSDGCSIEKRVSLNIWREDMKQIVLFILIASALTGCSTAGGHGFASSGENWYRNDAPSQQAEADLTDCKERSGYSKSVFLTERAAYSYDSFVENCMSRKGYEWTTGGKRPTKSLPNFPEQTSGATTVRPLK